MLIQGFYTVKNILKVDENTIHVSILLNKNHEVFKGHFPDNPITPGVCMIQTIKEITEEYLSKKLFLQRISNVKFTALINPFIDEELLLEISIVQENNSVKIKNITKFLNGTIALKCNGVFVKK